MTTEVMIAFMVGILTGALLVLGGLLGVVKRN